MLCPCTVWLEQFCRTRVSVEVWPTGTVAGLKENWLMAIPLVHAAVAAFAAPGTSIAVSGTTTVAAANSSLRNMSLSPRGPCGGCPAPGAGVRVSRWQEGATVTPPHNCRGPGQAGDQTRSACTFHPPAAEYTLPALVTSVPGSQAESFMVVVHR